MEIELELENEVAGSAPVTLETTMERLAAAAGLLEQAVERLCARPSAFALDFESGAEAGVGRIVATVESGREAELEIKLAAAEAELAELRAAHITAPYSVTNGRKTMPVSAVSLLAKQGLALESMEAGALDGALVSLSLEQRIAVKSELMRAGLLG